MNDQRLGAALHAIHQDRVDVPDAALVRQRLLAIPVHRIPQGRRWLPRTVATGAARRPALRFATASAIVILSVGLIGAAILTPQRETRGLPGAVASVDPSPTVSTTQIPRPFVSPHAIELARDAGFSTGILHFNVPTTGWVAYPSIDVGIGWTLEKGPYIDMGDWARPSARITITNSAPDGMYADPCAQVPGEPFSQRPDRADLAAAVTAIPGVEVVDAPERVSYVGALQAMYVAIALPDDACRDFRLWYDWDSPDRVAAPGDAIRVWIVDYPLFELRYWIVAETPTDADPRLSTEIIGIIDRIEHGG